MIVVDTSAVLAAIGARSAHRALLQRLTDDADLHAPHLIDVEVVHALRRLVATKEMSADRADDVRIDYALLPIVRYPHHMLLERMWELRHELSASDAAFVALSEALDVPLVTCDVMLAASPAHHAKVEHFPA